MAIKDFLARNKASKRTVREGETSRDRSMLDSGLLRAEGYIENPCKLIGSKGMSVFDKMLGDAQVKSTFFLKRVCRLSSGWDIIPREQGNPEAEEQAQFIRDVIEQMEGSLDSKLVKLWDAMRCGFKVAEKNYKYFEDGPLKGKIGIKDIKVRSSKYYAFDCDKHGNIKPDGLIEDPDGDRRKLPKDKFIIFTWGGNEDDGTANYGVSDFVCIYPHWFSNKLWLKLWSLTLERFSMPTAKGVIPAEAGIAERNYYLDILESLHTKSAVLFPPELEWEIIDSANKTKENQFQQALTYNNHMIQKGLLVGAMLQDSPQASTLGVGGLSETQFGVFIIVLNHLGEVTETDIMQEQFIRDLIDINYPPEKRRYPIFKMKKVEQKDNRAVAEVVKLLIEAGVIDREESWIRNFVGVPQLTEGEAAAIATKIEERKKAELDQALFQLKNELAKSGKATEKFEEWFAEYAESIKKKNSRDLSKFEKRADPVRQAVLQDRLFLSTAAKAQDIFRDEFKRIRKKIDRIGRTKDSAKRIIFPPGPLKKLWFETLMRSYALGKQTALEEINKWHKDSFADMSAAQVGEALEIDLSGYENIFWTETEFKNASKTYADRAFDFAGNQATAVSDDLQELVHRSIEEEWTESQFKSALDLYQVRYTGDIADEAKQLNSRFRTGMSSAYNDARFELFRSNPNVAGLQYSAILDERTTELCESLDQQIHPANDPHWLALQPPNHFNCRSIVVPVFVDEIELDSYDEEWPGGLDIEKGFDEEHTFFKTGKAPAPAHVSYYSARLNPTEPIPYIRKRSLTEVPGEISKRHAEIKDGYLAFKKASMGRVDDFFPDPYDFQTTGVQRVLREYTEDSELINSWLRGYKGDLSEIAKRNRTIPTEIELLDKATKEGRAVTDIIVYRGMDNPRLGKLIKEAKKLSDLKGATFSDDAYSSTSIVRESVFNTEQQVLIKVRKDTPGIYVNKISAHDTEYEFILGRGAVFEIEDIVKTTVTHPAFRTERTVYEIIVRAVSTAVE